MRRQDVYTYFSDRYSKEQVDEGLKKLNYNISSAKLPDSVIKDLKVILADSAKALSGSADNNSMTKQENKGKITSNSIGTPEQINLDVESENYGQLIEAFKKQGISKAEALMAISQDAFLRTLHNSNNEFDITVVQSIIAGIIKLKGMTMISGQIIDKDIPAYQTPSTNEIVQAAQKQVTGFDWEAIASKSNNSINWDSILGA